MGPPNCLHEGLEQRSTACARGATLPEGLTSPYWAAGADEAG
ncbi:hypothetical protein AB6846_03010 [Serratia proteamaculans]